MTGELPTGDHDGTCDHVHDEPHAAQYDEIWRLLRQEQADHPQGRLSHVGLEQQGIMRIVDVWNSMENFQAFGETLLPIIAKVGGEATPEIIQARHFQTA